MDETIYDATLDPWGEQPFLSKSDGATISSVSSAFDGPCHTTGSDEFERDLLRKAANIDRDYESFEDFGETVLYRWRHDGAGGTYLIEKNSRNARDRELMARYERSQGRMVKAAWRIDDRILIDGEWRPMEDCGI